MSDKTYELVVQTGPQVGEIYTITQDTVTLGRDPVSDIVVNDPEVSRLHARITRGETGCEIQDLGSTNGTFLDGKRLSGDPVPLSAGQTVSVGSNVTMMFMAAAEPEAADEELGTVLDVLMADDEPALPPLPFPEEPIPDPLGTVALPETDKEMEAGKDAGA
ncbi:MAG: FHA domain-containing protein, partial [Anaerolineales bacterium]|nr:FHA domain-containing protein [Anaerolineales bacterium]